MTGGGPLDLRPTGYVFDMLEAALWCTSTTDSFEAALVLAANLGHDADTVGAVTGQIAGAVYGASDIPQRWLAPLAWRERIEGFADRLVARYPGRETRGAARIGRANAWETASCRAITASPHRLQPEKE